MKIRGKAKISKMKTRNMGRMNISNKFAPDNNLPGWLIDLSLVNVLTRITHNFDWHTPGWRLIVYLHVPKRKPLAR
jgi:hypothetical protein